MKDGRLIALLVVVALATLLALVFRDRLSEATGDDVARIVYLLMALFVVAGGATAGGRLGATPLRNGLIWVCIVAALALSYQALAPLLPPGFGQR